MIVCTRFGVKVLAGIAEGVGIGRARVYLITERIVFVASAKRAGCRN